MVDMENMNSYVGVKGLTAIWQVFIFLSFASGRLYIRIVKMGLKAGEFTCTQVVELSF